MTSAFKRGLTAFILAGTGLAPIAHASIVTVEGDYLRLRYDTALLPSDFENIQLVETPFEWDCTDTSCAITALPTVAVVFGITSGEAVSSSSLSREFTFQTFATSAVDVVDPLGNVWGIAAADNGKWTFNTQIVGQHAPQDAQFAMAYGQVRHHVRYRSGPSAVYPTWANQEEVFLTVPEGWTTSAWTSAPTVLGFGQDGVVTWGPGDTGQSALDETGMNMSGPIANSNWKFRTDILGAHFALPSTTDPRCQSLSCMDFASGQVDVSGYWFSMPVIATVTTPVPEAGTVSLLALGLSLMAWQVRRRPANPRGQQD